MGLPRGLADDSPGGRREWARLSDWAHTRDLGQNRQGQCVQCAGLVTEAPLPVPGVGERGRGGTPGRAAAWGGCLLEAGSAGLAGGAALTHCCPAPSPRPSLRCNPVRSHRARMPSMEQWDPGEEGGGGAGGGEGPVQAPPPTQGGRGGGAWIEPPQVPEYSKFSPLQVSPLDRMSGPLLKNLNVLE